MVSIGDKIRVTNLAEGCNEPSISIGDEGIVTDIHNISGDSTFTSQIWVKFNNGSHLALLEGEDEFEVINNES